MKILRRTHACKIQTRGKLLLYRVFTNVTHIYVSVDTLYCRHGRRRCYRLCIDPRHRALVHGSRFRRRRRRRLLPGGVANVAVKGSPPHADTDFAAVVRGNGNSPYSSFGATITGHHESYRPVYPYLLIRLTVTSYAIIIIIIPFYTNV